MSSADTRKEVQLSFDFGDEPEEAHIYFVVMSFLNLVDRMGVERVQRIIDDVCTG
jgi:hypothetical protein